MPIFLNRISASFLNNIAVFPISRCCNCNLLNNHTRHKSPQMSSSTPANNAPSVPEYAPGSASIAYVTVPDEAAAATLARRLIEANLAACVNIVPRVTSVYRWQGAIQEDAEALLMIKTQTAQVAALCAFVRANHPYDVAEVIAVPIAQGNPPYMAFIADAMDAKTK